MPKPVAPSGSDAPPAPVKPVKKRKSVSIKTLNNENSWVIESSEDVDKYLASLKKQILTQLDDDTIINIEF